MECAFMLKRMGCAHGRKKMRKLNIHTKYTESQNTEFAEFGSG